VTIHAQLDPTLVTGAWREGDPVGARRFADVGDLLLESGVVLPDVRVAYESWGAFDGSNAVLILHALTGDSHVSGPSGPGHVSPGWWADLVGPGRAIDTDRLYVVAANILGGCQGTTGPASIDPDGMPWGGSFPSLTVRDQVQAEVALANELGIRSWRGVVGGSAGGMRALEWAIEFPERVERLFLLATGAADGAIKVWDIAGGYVTHTFRGPSVLVSALHFFELAAGESKDDSGKNQKKKGKKLDKLSIDKQTPDMV
jgi:homoserine O-acetyltransferase